MGDASFAVTNFTGGELCQYVQGNFTEPVYKTGLNLCSNALPIEEGAWVRRPGTQFAGFTRKGLQGRVIGFDIVASAPYDIELTAGWMRIWQGQSLALAEAAVSVSSITTANPAVLIPGSARTWATGDTVVLQITPDFNYLAAAYLVNRQFVVTKIDTTHFSLADQLGNTLDGSKFALGATVATVAKVFEVATPWADLTAIGNVRIAQSENQILMFGYQTVTQMLTVVAATPGYTLAAAGFLDGPYLDPPKDDSSVQSSGTSGSVTLTFSVSQGFTASNVGQFVRLLSEPPKWVSGHAYVPGDKTRYNGVYFNCIVATSTTNPPDTTPASQAICPSAAQWVYAVITAVASGTSVTATLKFIPQPPGPNIVVALSGPLLYTHDSADPITTYRMGAYWGTQWPQCGTFHEGRFWFAGAITNRADSAMANNGLICSPTFYDGTPADDCGVTAVFNFPEQMQINSMIPNHIGIVALCRSGEVLIQSSQLSDPITPTSIQAHQTTRYGSEKIEPLSVGYSTLFVNRYGKKLFDLAPNFFNSQRISAINVSLTGRHLTQPGLLEIRAQRELAPLIWARAPNGMGNWIGMTYKREDGYGAAGPIFNGWHRHSHGNGGRYPLSFATGTVSGGATDTLAMVTLQSNNTVSDYNVAHVEFLTGIFQEGQSTLCAWQLDDAIVPVSSTLTYSGGLATGIQYYGLWHVIGRTVSAYVGGVDLGDFVVASDGSVTIPFGTYSGIVFNQTFLAGQTSTCNTANVTYQTTNIPAALANPTIMSMGISGTIAADPSVADWTNRRFFQLDNTTGTTFIKSYNMDLGTLIATSPANSLNSKAAIDSTGNVYTVDGTDNNPLVKKYDGAALTLTSTFLTSGFGTISHGNMACVGGYLLLTSGANYYVVNTATMAQAQGTTTLSAGKNSLLFASTTGSICFAVDGYLVTSNTSFKLWSVPVPTGVPASLGTILATDIDAAWTHVQALPLAVDLTDGNPIVLCTTVDAVTHQNYIVKLNASTAAVMWKITTGGLDARNTGSGPATNTHVQFGTLAYYDVNGNVYAIDTIAGTILSTVAVVGVTFPGSGGAACSSDATGDIFVFSSYVQGVGTPVPLGATPSSYSNLWARIDLAGSVGVGTQNRLANYSVPSVIGFRYTSKGQLLRQQSPETSGARNGPAMGKTRRTHRASAYFVNAISNDVYFGTDFTTMFKQPLSANGESRTVLQPYTGISRLELSDDYSFDSMIAWQTNSAYPLAIAAVEGFLGTADL